MLSNLGPNIAILKQPSNWFLVAFSVSLLMFVAYIFYNKRNTENG